MADPAFADGVAQRRGDVLLADQLVEPLRPVLAVQRLEGHGVDLTQAPRPGASIGDADRAPAVDPTPKGA